MSGALRCYLIRVSLETIHQNIFQLISQNIYGFLFWGLQRKGFFKEGVRGNVVLPKEGSKGNLGSL
jgi:hypothetical protein